MDYSDKYRFADFTLKNYHNLLELALKNYKFKLFTDSLNLEEKSILLRHDMEFSIPIALQMAVIESDLGIFATYLIQIHSDFYNPLETKNIKAIKEIMNLGHQVGLHFDAHFWEINSEENLEKFINFDKETLENYLNTKIRVFSFHNTNKFLLSCEKDTYAGLINVYSKYYKKEIGYCADSLGYWRYEILENKLKEAKDNFLQVLIHDGMWQPEVLPPRKRIFKVIDSHADLLKNEYDLALKKFDGSNIDWDKIL